MQGCSTDPPDCLDRNLGLPSSHHRALVDSFLEVPVLGYGTVFMETHSQNYFEWQDVSDMSLWQNRLSDSQDPIGTALEVRELTFWARERNPTVNGCW